MFEFVLSRKTERDIEGKANVHDDAPTNPIRALP